MHQSDGVCEEAEKMAARLKETPYRETGGVREK